MQKILVPLVNTNDPEAQVAKIFIRQGQQVQPGDPICSLLTTKANFEVTAEVSGYIDEVLVDAGSKVTVGDVICTISPDPVVVSVVPEKVKQKNPRITRPALDVANKLGIDIEKLPTDRLITESMIRAMAGHLNPNVVKITPPFSTREVIIYGGGGHARTIIDLLRTGSSFLPYGVVDDGLAKGEDVLGVTVLGNRSDLPQIYSSGIRLAINAVGALQKIETRIEIFQLLANQGFSFPAIIHSRAFVEPSARIDEGSQILAMAYVGSAADVKFGAIVNTGSIVSHDCIVGEFVHIAPGAHLAGGVEVGSGSLIGMGVTTAVGVRIGERVQIGNGARVHGDVPAEKIIRSGMSWPESFHG